MRMLNMFPFAPHLAFWLTHYGGTEFGTFVLGTGGGKDDGHRRQSAPHPQDQTRRAHRHADLSLSRADRGRWPTASRCRICTRSCSAAKKRRSACAANCARSPRQLGAEKVDVLRTYGFTEAKLAWAECPFHEDAGSAGYHIHPDLALIEIVDPKTGEPRGEGEPGEIVFTPLDARGSVVLRYRTGDCIDGGLFHEPCPYCGRDVPRLVGEISRNSEVRDLQLDKLKGTLVDFNQLEHVLDNAEHVGTWQLELRKQHDDPLELDELILHVAKSDDCDDEQLRASARARISPARRRFTRTASSSTPSRKCASMQGVGTQLKEQRVVDHRPERLTKLRAETHRDERQIVMYIMTHASSSSTASARHSAKPAPTSPSLGADDLGRIAVDALLTRTGLDPALIDEVIFGCVGQPAEAANIARVIALRAGIPESVPAMTVHRNCASGFEAITTAYERMRRRPRLGLRRRRHGEHVARADAFSADRRAEIRRRSAKPKTAAAKARGASPHFAPPISSRASALKLGLTDPVCGLNMGETAELLAREDGITREQQDAFALRSHQRALAAEARLAEEICPVYLGGKADRPRQRPAHRTSRSRRSAGLQPDLRQIRHA